MKNSTEPRRGELARPMMLRSSAYNSDRVGKPALPKRHSGSALRYDLRDKLIGEYFK
jgi:hypothetical protein